MVGTIITHRLSSNYFCIVILYNRHHRIKQEISRQRVFNHELSKMIYGYSYYQYFYILDQQISIFGTQMVCLSVPQMRFVASNFANS